jgi:hypothetical protein
MVKQLPALMETEGSLPFAQNHATERYPEAIESSLDLSS